MPHFASLRLTSVFCFFVSLFPLLAPNIIHVQAMDLTGHARPAHGVESTPELLLPLKEFVHEQEVWLNDHAQAAGPDHQVGVHE